MEDLKTDEKHLKYVLPVKFSFPTAYAYMYS